MSDYSNIQETSLHSQIMEGKVDQKAILAESANIIKLFGLNPKTIEHIISEDGEDQLIFPLPSNMIGLSKGVMANLVKKPKFVGLLIEQGYITLLVKSENK